jgi:hypothetical protein
MGHKEMVKLLIDHGADINIKGEMHSSVNEKISTII